MVTPENRVKAEIMRYLKQRGITAWNNPSGAVRIAPDRWFRFGKKGSADILGCLPGGRFLAVEVKAARGVLSPEQKTFLAEIRGLGGLAVMVRDWRELQGATPWKIWRSLNLPRIIVLQRSNKGRIGAMPFAKKDPRINRRGRPKKGQALTDILNYKLDQKNETGKLQREAVAEKLIALALEGDMAAIRYVMTGKTVLDTLADSMKGRQREAVLAVQD
ncbi:MAG: VRR-NUC domain-containing protein [Treponema sp.]|jgi:hypothetical protein|nr:VRR-NUC domain-containing protein [Treponema sp.]